MKKLVICGDSWLTADLRAPGQHFSEIISNRYEVINLARGGISNVGICFQIKTALELQPDAIVYNITDSSRLEVPIGEFVENNGLKNFRYSDSASASVGGEYVGSINAPIISDVAHTLAEDSDWMGKNKYGLSDEQKLAIKYYLTHLFDANLQNTLNQWMLNYWIKRAIEYGIKVIGPQSFLVPVIKSIEVPE